MTAFLDRLLAEVCEDARTIVRRAIESRTLRRSLDCVRDRQARVPTIRLTVPQYWAIYYHDGRGPVTARPGKFLVYFRSIEDDPRVRGGLDYPVRATQIRRLALSVEEFKELRKQGKLIVRKKVGATRPRPFYERLRNFQARVAPKIQRRFRSHVQQELADALDLKITAEL